MDNYNCTIGSFRKEFTYGTTVFVWGYLRTISMDSDGIELMVSTAISPMPYLLSHVAYAKLGYAKLLSYILRHVPLRNENEIQSNI